MWDQKASFRFEIDNFSKKKAGIASQVFVAGGCEWYLNAWPKGHRLIGDHLAVYLYVANPKSLGTGWERTASYYYVALDQSDRELYRSSVQLRRFGAENMGWGFSNTLHLPNFQEKGVLENDRLIIEFYVKVVEAFDGERGDVSMNKEIVDINGFQVSASLVTLVRNIFTEHPDIAIDFKLKNQVVKTEYMKVLLGLINTLNKCPHKLSETEITSAHSELSELTDVGFKLEWLKTKLGNVSLKGKESDHVFIENKKSDDADGSRVQQLEERVKNLELMDLESLKSKLEEVSLERKKADAAGSRVQQLEESVKNLELIVSDLKAKLDKQKAKSSDAGFLLVDEVCFM